MAVAQGTPNLSLQPSPQKGEGVLLVVSLNILLAIISKFGYDNLIAGVAQ